MVSLKCLFLLVNGEAEDEDTNSLFGEASKFHKPGNDCYITPQTIFPPFFSMFYSFFSQNVLTEIIECTAWLAQLGEHRSAQWEVAGSNPGRTNSQDP